MPYGNRQPPAFTDWATDMRGNWYPSGAAADQAEGDQSFANLQSNDWPSPTIGIGEERWFVHRGAGLYDSRPLWIARDVSELEVVNVDLDTGNPHIGEYHVYQVPPGATAVAQYVKYVDPGHGDVPQGAGDRMIIFAPMAGLFIDVTTASGSGANMGILVTARA